MSSDQSVIVEDVNAGMLAGNTTQLLIDFHDRVLLAGVQNLRMMKSCPVYPVVGTITAVGPSVLDKGGLLYHQTADRKPPVVPYLYALVFKLVGSSDLEIVIGSENQTSQLRSCTVVLTTYGPSRRLKGVLGVVGPTRMDYGQTVGRLQAVARRASERLSEAWF